MRRLTLLGGVLVVVAVQLLELPATADTFGSGDNAFEIEFVTIGQPGNPLDDAPNPAGAVDYVYRIGKYEVSEQMIDKANALGNLGITIDTRGPDKPATSVTWFEAATFVNWLNTCPASTSGTRRPTTTPWPATTGTIPRAATPSPTALISWAIRILTRCFMMAL